MFWARQYCVLYLIKCKPFLCFKNVFHGTTPSWFILWGASNTTFFSKGFTANKPPSSVLKIQNQIRKNCPKILLWDKGYLFLAESSIMKRVISCCLISDLSLLQIGSTNYWIHKWIFPCCYFKTCFCSDIFSLFYGQHSDLPLNFTEIRFSNIHFKQMRLKISRVCF